MNKIKVGKRVFPFLLIIMALLFFGFPGSGLFLKNKLSQVKKDWDMMKKGMAAYGMDRCGMYYPPDTAERRRENPDFSVTFETSKEYITKRPVGTRKKIVEFWCPLTTPIAYIVEYPFDPFRPGAMYGYACWNFHDDKNPFAFLHSPGPDKDDDIAPALLKSRIDKYFKNQIGMCNWKHEDYGVMKSLVLPYLYDPTNGAQSSGDLIWMMDVSYSEWGWKKEEGDQWKNAVLPELPPYAAENNKALPEGWEPGEQLPPPRTVAEKMTRKRIIPLPDSLYRAMNDTGYLFYPPGGKLSVNLEILSGVQNMFARNYESFFREPGALTPEQIKTLEAWEQSEPKWWNSMKENQKPDSASHLSLQAQNVYIFLPFFGKSQLLLAARDLAQGEREKSQERIKNLKEIVQRIGHAHPGDEKKLAPYEQRVESELLRLSEALQKK